MQILKSVSKSFVAATRWLPLVCAFGTFPVFAQVGQTVNWVGGNSFASYSDTNNWNPKVVPVNNGGTNFTVIVPDSANLTLDIGGPGAIDALALRVGSFLDILVSNRLTVNGVALVRGTVQVTGTGSGFSAMGSQTVMEANPQLWAYQGGQIGLSASTYSWAKYNGNATLIYAADPGSSVTLTNLSSMSLSYGDYGAWTYLIGADNGGLVDLRNLGQVSGPGSDDWLEFRLNSGADIRLDKVQQSSGNVRFQVNSASYSLPSLNRASATQFNVATNNILSVPSLIAVDNATISVADNALFTATNLLSLDNVVVNLTGTGTFMATNLAAFRNSDIAMWPGKSLFIGLLTDINSSRLAVTSGGLLRVAAASYNTPSSWQWYGTLFSADGAGSLLDLSTVAAMTTHYCNWSGYGYRYMVNANNNGVIDLSGLTTLTGPEYSDRLLEFNIGNGGNILLGNLRQILGYTRFNINVPTFSMPGLQSVATTTFSVGAGDTLSLPQAQTMSSCAISLGDGARMDLPQLQSYTSGSVTWGFNGTLNTPGLIDVSLSSISWQPGQNLIAPPFTTIYGAQLLVSGGETGRVAATSYNTPSSWQWYGTLFSADGAGSLLDLSTVAAMTTHYCNWSGYGYRYMVNANNNGVIDLSGLTTLTGPEYSDRLLEFNIGNGGNILLGNLRQILGYTRFNINVPTFSMPGLQSVATTTFSVGASDTLSLPKAQTLSSCAISLGDGARMDLPQLQSYTSGSVTWGFNGTLNTPMLTDVSLSSISWQPGQNLIAPLFTNIYGAQLLVNGGETGRVAAVSYNTPSGWQWYGTLFSADGAGSLLDLSTVAAMTTHYCNWSGYGYRYMVNANNNGVIDLSGLTTLTGPEYSDRLLEFNVSNGGATRFGNVSLYSYLTLNASGTSSLLEFDGIYARSTVKIGVSAKAIIDSKGDFLYENTDTSSIVVEGAYFQMDGTRPQRLEVGGRDLGAVGASSRNFGYSQLIVGSTNQSSVVNLVDTLNNGNRGTGGTPEALYLYGQDGAGLRLYNGSRLALNGINCYAFVNGQMKRLNDLIPAGTNSVAFDGGFLVNDGGPRITNMTPSVALTPIVSSVTVSFDQPIDPASFTASDVSISGPSGAVAATGVTLVSNTTWMVSFQPQSTDGTYAVKVGPNIDELAGNIHGLDQNGDGLAGDGTNDVFMGTFVIDGTAPLLVSAYGLQFGNRIGVTFNEPLVATFATNPANYAIDGQAASNAVLQADRSLVALSVTPAAGSVFSLSVTGVTDLLGNVTNRLLDGTILPLQPMDIGISGDSREAGWSVPWSSTNFDIVAGGYAISSSSDSFHFLSEQRTGDFDVQVRLDSYKGTGGAQAGIMFRENLTSGSSHIFWAEEPSNGYYVWWRNLQGGGTSNAKTQSGSNLTNNWLRLKRVGNVFTMYQRTNGLNWALHYSVTNSLATKGYLGLATSRNSSDTSTNVLVRYRSYSDIIPAIVAQPQSQSVTSGVTVVFGASAYGLPTLAYQWFFNGLPLTGATSNLLSLPSVTVENVGDYRVVITNTFGAATSVVASLTVDGQGLGGFEGDVSPRPLGNNSVSVADWVQVGRFVAGLDAVMNSGEFQRADCAPRAIGGNGVLSIADWTQAGRYAAGLDPLVEAWGPTEPISQTLGARLSSLRNPMRVIQLIGPGTVWQGTEFVVPVTLTSQGNENALGFSLTFDPARLAFRGVTLDAGLAGAFVQINTQAVAKGEFGMALANPTEQSFTQGNVPIAMLRFAAIGTAGDAVVAFADAPVLREIVDPTATPLGASYASSLARIAGHPSFSAVERVIGNGLRFKLIGTPGQSFIIQTSTDLRQWAPLATNVFGSDPVTWVDPNGPGDKQRFYRMAPLP